MLFTSQRADFITTASGRNLNALDAPSIYLNGIGNGDFIVTAGFLNIQADQQIGIFVGTSADNVFRGGIEVGTQAFAINNVNGVISAPRIGSLPNESSPGHDGIIEIGRVGGLWHWSWQNVTNPDHPYLWKHCLLPKLDGQNDLYVGIFNSGGVDTTQQTAIVDYFTVLTGSDVPEPASIPVCSIGLVASVFARRRRHELKPRHSP